MGTMTALSSFISHDAGAAYRLSKQGVIRLVRRTAPTWGPKAPGSFRCRRALSTHQWAG
jgi:hypothetical protein